METLLYIDTMTNAVVGCRMFFGADEVTAECDKCAHYVCTARNALTILRVKSVQKRVVE